MQKFRARCARPVRAVGSGFLNTQTSPQPGQGAGNGVEEASFLYFFLREKHTTEEEEKNVCSVL